MWSEPDDAAVRELLRQTRSVAVVGVSPDPLRPSNGVYRYLRQSSGYQLYPVNPNLAALDGQTAYPDLAALPVVPDMVDVFRRQEHLRAVLDQAISVGAKSIWLQQGLWDEQLARDAEAAGLRVVMDRCLKVEYARLIGAVRD